MGFDIFREWKNSRLPIINGILYEDGSIRNIYVIRHNSISEIKLGERSHINSLINDKDFFTIYAYVLNTVKDNEKMIMVSCGDGSFGGDGFVIVEKLDQTKIKWIFVSDNSNPFEKVRIVNDSIFAYNNLNEKWIFEINNPTNIIIRSI